MEILKVKAGLPVTIKDSAGTTLYVEPAGNTRTILDGQAVNSDASFSIPTVAEAITPLPNINYTDIYGNLNSIPSCKDIIAVIPTYYYANTNPVTV